MSLKEQIRLKRLRRGERVDTEGRRGSMCRGWGNEDISCAQETKSGYGGSAQV